VLHLVSGAAAAKVSYSTLQSPSLAAASPPGGSTFVVVDLLWTSSPFTLRGVLFWVLRVLK
jgi:hypothetical protein